MLVDTGVDPPGLWGWEPEVEGRLVEEVDPADVSQHFVFLTHLHVDHVGWNAERGRKAPVPPGRYVVHEDALAFARGHDEPTARAAQRDPSRASTSRRCWARSSSRRAWWPSRRPATRSGAHGPAARLDEGISLADVAVHPALLDHPEWVFAFDDDSVANAPTRAALVAELAAGDGLVVCGHYPGSGIGRLVTREGRVVWEET